MKIKCMTIAAKQSRVIVIASEAWQSHREKSPGEK